MYSRILICGNVVFFIIRYFDVAKFTTLIPLSLLFSREFFLTKRFSYAVSETDRIHDLVPHKNYFYSQLVHAHSEQ
jgi:hypothetical protein